MRYLNGLVFLTLLATTLPTQAMSDDEFKAAHALYLVATKSGEEADIEHAEQQLHQLAPSPLEHALIQVYLGSLESLKATTVFFPWSKMRHVEQGVEMMDRALERIAIQHQQMPLAGVTISLRMQLIVAYTYYTFPRFLNYAQDAKDLVADILESPQLPQATTPFKNDFYQLAANMAQDEDHTQQQQYYLKQIQPQQLIGEQP